MKKKTLLYLNLRQTVQEARAALLAAKRLGYDVILISDKPFDIFQGYIKHVCVTDTYNIPETLEVIDQIWEEENFDGVITWGDRDVELMAAVAEKYKLPGPSLKAAKNARNKYLMREALKNRHDLLPKYHQVIDEDSLKKAITYVGFPAVLKPTGASGSKGIFKINSVEEARKAFNSLLKIADQKKDKIFSYYGAEFIYEEYLDGPEFSVEGWVSNDNIFIVGITDKETTRDYHIEYQHIFPSYKQIKHKDIIKDNSALIVRELGLNNCAFHLEAKWTEKGFKLVEIAARIGGDYITSHLVPMATNINFYEELLKIVVGEPCVSSISYTQYVGMHAFLTKEPGKLIGIENLNYILANPNMAHIFLEQPIGKDIQLPPDNFSLLRVATLLAQSHDYQLLSETFSHLSKTCTVCTEDRNEIRLSV